VFPQVSARWWDTRWVSQPSAMRLQPVYRTILALDAVGSTMGTNATRFEMRRKLYEVVEKATQTSGPFVDRGDGMLVLLNDVPKTWVITTVVPRIVAGLDFPVRVAMHAGEVHRDERGYFGEAIDLTCRLVDAPQAKRRAPVFVVSDDIYRSVVCHGYDGIDPGSFEPLGHVRLGGRTHRGWVQSLVAPSGHTTATDKPRSWATTTTSAVPPYPRAG
jgi:hypothetical protein